MDFNPSVGSEQSGIRPGVIVQCDAVNKHKGKTVITCPITGNLAKTFTFTVQVEKNKENGLKQDSVILCDQIKTIDSRRLKKKLGHLHDMSKIDFALKTILQLH